MKNKVRHVLGISGGKDSAALAIYVKREYPQLDIEYYFCDTGKELDETYELVKNLEIFLGKKVKVLQAAAGSHESPFDHFIKYKGKFLPSSINRWCTKNLKLDPFEKYVGDDPVVSYVGIRGDEDREGYISTKPNIQSIFPFRKNIWSQDVIDKVLKNDNIPNLLAQSKSIKGKAKSVQFLDILTERVSPKFPIAEKLNTLLSLDTTTFNRIVLQSLKNTNYPLSQCDDFPLTENEDVLVRDDIFKILRESGVGVPKYYEKIEYQFKDQKGEYSRSRSGCYFCFYQQKIEWVWLYEQHPELFKKAMEYEKDGYTWSQGESLKELIEPQRIQQIKEEHFKRTARTKDKQSPYLLDILGEAEGEGCASCFI